MSNASLQRWAILVGWMLLAAGCVASESRRLQGKPVAWDEPDVLRSATTAPGPWYPGLSPTILERLAGRARMLVDRLADAEAVTGPGAAGKGVVVAAVRVTAPVPVTGWIWRVGASGWHPAPVTWWWQGWYVDVTVPVTWAADGASGVVTGPFTWVPLAPGALPTQLTLRELAGRLIEPPDFAPVPAPLRWYANAEAALQLSLLDPYVASYAYTCVVRAGYRGPMLGRIDSLFPYRVDMESVCLFGETPESIRLDLIGSGHLLGTTGTGELVGLHYHGDLGYWFPIRWRRSPEAVAPAMAEAVTAAQRALEVGISGFRAACEELYTRWRSLWQETDGGIARTPLTSAQLDQLAGTADWRGAFVTPALPRNPFSPRIPVDVDWPLLYDDYWRRQVLCRLFEPEVRADPEAVRKLHELTGLPEEEIAHTARVYGLLWQQLRESLAAVGVSVPEEW